MAARLFSQDLVSSIASRRSQLVDSFRVMEVLQRAQELEAAGRRVIHLEIGQPSTGAPPSAAAAASRALASGAPLGYTTANGLSTLRSRIARWYEDRYGSAVDPERVVVTTGSSAGFLLAFSALCDAGDAVAVPSTAYPCYRNVLRALGCEPVSIPCSTQFGFPGPEEIGLVVDERARLGLAPMRALVLSSPANPTGTTLDAASLAELAETCRAHNVRFISDEIYSCIEYDREPTSAVDIQGVVVINSFSKFFCMSGWRVGWLVLPDVDAEPQVAASVTRLQQNCFINAPTISQIAAEAAFDDADTVLDDRVRGYAASRDAVLDGLKRIGVHDDHVAPATGAFYVYCDLKHMGVDDTAALCAKLLEDTGVALAPGLDFEFDPAVGKRRVRFSYCGATEDVVEAMDILHSWWPRRL